MPDNTSVNITNYIFTGSYSVQVNWIMGMTKITFVWLSTPTKASLPCFSFPSTTTFANGTTVTNDSDLIFYDSNLTMMGASWATNPETLLTNLSTTAHGGMVYISIYRYQGVGTWNLILQIHRRKHRRRRRRWLIGHQLHGCGNPHL